MLAETAEEVVELAFEGVVDAEFVDSGGGLWSVGHGGGWQQSRERKRLEQCASVHEEDCNRGLAM